MGRAKIAMGQVKNITFMANFTEKAIIESLKELLEERPIDKITVKEITERCGVSRNTFYYHFHDTFNQTVRLGGHADKKNFADIFFNNSAKNGLLLITLKEAEVEALQQSAASGEYRIEVDLENEEINLPEGKKLKFNYDPFRKHCLLNGLDDIDYLLSHREDIDAFRKKRSEYDFFSATTPNR